MKKLISFILAAFLLISSFAACSVEPTTSGTASDDADSKYTVFLGERLDTMPDTLVIASGADAKAYGVDTTDFAYDDGYTIRATDGDVVILGKTDAALDRAVRHFAKYGNNESYSYTYGEEYRVKRLTISGNDISEYTIIRPDDADECMRYATDELVKFTRLACGTTLPVYSVSDYAVATDKPIRTITLKIDYPALGDEAFTIDVKDDGNIDILCGRYRGGLYGVYGLLQGMGWRFLGDNIEYIYEADHIDLTSAINRTEDAAIPYRSITEYTVYDYAVGSRLNLHGRYPGKEQIEKYGYYGLVREASHGLQEFERPIDWQGLYEGIDVAQKQPCFTNEDILQVIEDHYRAIIEKKIAAGVDFEKDFPYIDVAQFDNGTFCMCGDCLKVLSVEKSNAGAVLRMTNRMAEMVEEYVPGLPVLMLAYNGTNKAPIVTKPRDNVKIAYCFYLNGGDAFAACSNHTLVGGECSGGYNNNGFYKEFEEWKAICSADNLQVWYYPLNMYEVGFQLPTFDILYDDLQYIIDSGVSAIILCSRHNNDTILMSVAARLLWNNSITKEEYWDMVKECFNIVYGAAGDILFEYTMMLQYAGDLEDCWCAFHSDVVDMVDDQYIKSNFDYMVTMLDHALRLAETEKTSNLIETVKAKLLYIGITLTHEDRYVNGTEEQRAVIEEQYHWMHEMFIKHDIPVFDDYTDKYYPPAEIDLSRTPSDHWFGSING